MDYKEKLRLAKEALESGSYDKDTIEYIFPELRESEDDKIRKELMDFIYVTTFPVKELKKKERFLDWLEKQGDIDKSSYEIAEKEKVNFVGDGFIKCNADFLDFKEGITYLLEYIGDDMYNVRSDNLLGKKYHITPCQLYTVFKKLTWLEKQGANSVSVTKCNTSVTNSEIVSHPTVIDSDGGKCTTASTTIEPKFKVGDWVVNNNSGCVYQVTEIRDDEYCLWLLDAEIEGYLRIIDVDNDYHLWDIQEDVKNGDVLAGGYGTFIFMGENDGYCGVLSDNTFIRNTGNNEWTEGLHPATKEQHNTLIKAMADAGWEFDFEKKELKKIEQKSAWSEGDEEMLENVIFSINHESVMEGLKSRGISYSIDSSIHLMKNLIDWLKSLKDRITWKPMSR